MMGTIVLFSVLALFGLTLWVRALSANAPMKIELGEFNDLPVLGSSTIYEGSAVGLSSGYARALVAGDAFMGHAFEGADNSLGANGAINVRTRTDIYKAQVALTSVAVTDVGKDVYMSDDATYTLTEGSNSYVGKIYRYVTTNTCIVEFHPITSSTDQPNHQHTAATDGGALTSPHVVTGIEDTNGNEVIGLGATGSAVNEVTITNAAAGNKPSIAATGDETDIGLSVLGKGTGTIQVGQATGTVALATTTTDKIGFFGVTPVVQQAKADFNNWTAATDVAGALAALGLVDSA